MRRNKLIAVISLVVCLLCMTMPITAAQAQSTADDAPLEARVKALEATVRDLVELLAQEGGYSDQSFRAFAESLGIDVSTLTPGEEDERGYQEEEEEDGEEQESEEQGEWEDARPSAREPGIQPVQNIGQR